MTKHGRKDNRTYLDPAKAPDYLRLPPQKADKLIAAKTKLIRKYFQRHGFKKAVIGLSGGIDSAVAAALVTRAIGPENVIVLRLPCGPATESVTIAGEIAAALGIPDVNVHTVNIGEAVEASWRAAKDVLGERGDSALQRGNMAARERMKILEHTCSLFGGILIGTENRTEHLLAYYTIGGDNISGLEPFLDLFKVQIYALAAQLGLPESVLKRKPTAELWADQTDEGELGVDYLTIDIILAGIWDRRLAARTIAKRYGVAPETIRKVIAHVASKTGKREAPYIVP
ncbi:MAG: NAD(+) synthase [Patescibacteria group bacterium]